MSARVLVVDDIEVNVRLLEAKLLSEYYEVLTASNGPAALEIALRESPDIVLLDVMMPGMDGLEVCRRLKSDPATRYIPIVMVTALSDVSDRLRGLEVGADDFLTKPVNDLALFARLRSLIRLKRTLDEWLLREEINGRLASLPGESAVVDVERFEPGRILVVEENALAANKLNQILQPLARELVLVKNNADANALALQNNFDLIIISMALEHSDPLRLVSQLRAVEQTRQLPVLLILDDGDYTRLAKGLDLGANDYVVRPVDRNELVARVRIQMKRKRLQDQLLDNYKRGLTLALTDGLTGLYNRRYLTAHLETLFGRGGAAVKDVAVLLFDIDRFKRVNDTYGHAAGDAVLIEVAKRALSNVRGFDLVARYGGEEFLVIMPESTLSAAAAVADRLRRAIGEHLIDVSERALRVTVSIGVAVTGGGVMPPAQLLKNADEALYAAKHAGRNKVMVWHGTGPQVHIPQAVAP
ncbi:MAG: two-component system, cell cycle response regulator [Aliidongia sp.]|jgi:two-component system cell cycle response regulator|nr:two-component system, cell cycle response regulator [Aliidongia sp.]